MDDGAQETSHFLNAVDGTGASLDWEALRVQSIEPYGFGPERVRLWPKLLHVKDEVLQDLSSAAGNSPVVPKNNSYLEEPSENEPFAEVVPHADERQIGLDTDRSFVLYPVGPEDATANREKLQAGLNHLIVSLFRRRSRLHYFQGYHDIVSVLYLSLPKELHLPTTEKMSLHRVRDSMGTTLEPVVGLLRILKRILHLADEKFAVTLEGAAPLPYYALSNLLTLFSHDVPTLPLIQHIFDYLLCRPPIAVVYLAAALTLMRREEVQVLEDEGEEGMMHSLLTSLPDLYEEGDDPVLPKEEVLEPEAAPKLESQVEEAEPSIPSDTDALAPPKPKPDDPASGGTPEGNVQGALSEPPVEDQAQDDAHAGEPHATEADEAQDAVLPKETKAEHNNEHPSESHPGSEPESDALEAPLSEKNPPPRSRSPEPLDSVRAHRPRISLTALLARADALYAQYPPTHPGVAVDSVMGPQSVMRTWSEHRAEVPSDDDAERMVLNPDLIVLPHIESDDIASDGDSFRTAGSARKGRKGEKDEKEKRRRRLRKPRRLTDLVVRRKTMVAGAVLVLGVAMAVYGINGGLPGAGAGHHRGGFGREWRKVGRYLGGAIVGAGERMFDGIHHGLHW
ncbi:rab-GTPase-TBC domain-containing protein [Lenzites betulinus]|nr:rab-GTPase-TBC domain-containing protein [Lenzites betulinus]